MGIYWKNIDPEMQILGPTQQFIFNQNLNQFQFDNTFVPTSLVPSQNLFELRNSGLSGFRFRHETAFGDTHGTLKIQSFLNGQTTGTDLMTFNQDGTITFDSPLAFDNLNFAKLGIGINPSTDGRIEFANTSLDTKIRMFANTPQDNPFDQSGFGYLSTAGTLYHCPIGQSHLFFAGANGNLPVEINALGMIINGIGYSPTDFRKLTFYQKYQTNNTHQLYGYGILLTGGSFPDSHFDLRSQIASSSGAFSWNYGTSDTTSNELMRLHPTNGLIVKNQIVPTEGNPTHTYFKIENLSGGGHRFVHSITAGGIPTGVGSLTLQVMDGSQSTIDILNFGFSTLSFPGFGGDTYAIFGGFNANAANATLGVNEGKWNVSNEASCFRVVSLTNSAKIEIQNTSISGRLYELRSNSDGSFGIFDRTSNALRLGIDASGSISGNFTSGLGQNVALPFAQLNFNWANGSGGTPYIFNHAINDSAPFFKKHIYQVTSVSPDVQRTWQALYSLGDPNAWNPEYSLTFYHPIFSPGGTTPFQLLNIGGGFSAVWGLYIRATIDMGGFEIKNALNPTTAQSLATKNYIDTRRLDQFVAPTSALNINSQALNSVSSMAIGAASATLASLFIQGGVVSGSEDAAIYLTSSNLIHSITMQNTNALGGRTYKIRNNANGSLDFFDQNALTPRLTIDSSGNALFSNTIYGRRVSGLMTMQGNAIGTTVTTGGLFYKVAGTTSSSNLNALSMPTSNRLTWTSSPSGTAMINFYLTASHNGAGGDEIQFVLYKNGTQISNSLISGQGSNNTLTSYCLGTTVAMALNDYIELWCSHPSNGKIITVKNMICNFSTT